MFQRLTSLLVVGVLALPASAQDVAVKKTDGAAAILAKLRGEWTPLKSQPTATVEEVVTALTANYDIAVIINYEAFKANGVDPVLSRHVNTPAAKGLAVRTVLNTSLAQFGGTFLVRKDHIEFVPLALAGKLTKVAVEEGEGIPRLTESLVSVIAKERPLNDLVSELAEEFDLNVVVSPQAGDSRMAFVTARLLNVSAEKALETIAATADLRVVRNGDVYLITSFDHATAMFNEKQEREKQKIEVELLRKGQFPPGPPPPETIPPPVEKK